MRIVQLLLVGLVLALATPAGADQHEAESTTPQPSAGDGDEAAPLAPAGQVSRSVFSTAVEDREPVDDISTLSNDHQQILFFTELTGLDGQTVSHRWERDGEVMAEVSFDVQGQRWRVWSTKKLDPGWTGEWSVSVIDGSGRVLDSKQFSFVSSSPSPALDTAESAAPASPPVEPPASPLD